MPQRGGRPEDDIVIEAGGDNDETTLDPSIYG
jgi:hypothetical protein